MATASPVCLEAFRLDTPLQRGSPCRPGRRFAPRSARGALRGPASRRRQAHDGLEGHHVLDEGLVRVLVPSRRARRLLQDELLQDVRTARIVHETLQDELLQEVQTRMVLTLLKDELLQHVQIAQIVCALLPHIGRAHPPAPDSQPLSVSVPGQQQFSSSQG